jgi:hypothetical protein
LGEYFNKLKEEEEVVASKDQGHLRILKKKSFTGKQAMAKTATAYPAMSRGYYYGPSSNNLWSNEKAWIEKVNVESRAASNHRSAVINVVSETWSRA